VLQRGNLNAGADVFSLSGASDITLQDLTIAGANFGVELSGKSVGDSLLNDTIQGNSDVGVIVDVNNGGTATAVSGLLIEADLIMGNGLDVPYGTYYGGNQSGVTVLQGNGALQMLNDTVMGNNQYGVYLQDGYQGAGVSTIDGGAYDNQTGNYGGAGYGIYDSTGSVIENAQVYGNHNNGITESNNPSYGATAPGQVTGNTVHGNGGDGINATGADVLDNLVYSQTNTNNNAIALGGGSTGMGNTVYGSANGIYVAGGALAEDNLAYDVSGTGVYYTTSAPLGIIGNTVFGDNVGISGGEYYTGAVIPIEGNLVYDNLTTGIALNGGLYQQVINNTIDQPLGTGISITHNYGGGGASYTTIENNVLVVGAGPAIYVEPDAETGFLSDYNLFDVTGSGAIGNWEKLNYTSLATWYYELGFDQHSLTGDPLFASAPATTPVVIDANTANPGFSLTDASAWTAVPGHAGVGSLSYLTTSYGPTAAATWTFTGLTVGTVYEVAATWSANTDTGKADYVVTDGTSNVLASTSINQYGSITSGITNNGSLYSLIGLFTATTTTAVVTLTDDINNYHTLNVIADAMLLQPLGNDSADFHVQAGSPTIDAGDPTTPYLLEPGPNGGRVNLGYDGNTPQAQVSPSAQSIQVLTPAGMAKYQIGEQMPIDFQTDGLLTSQPILLLHAGGASIATGLQGNWSADAYGTGQTSETFNASQIASIGNTVPSAPAALFDSGAYINGSTVGQKMSYTLPVGPGTYTLTLYFADPVVGHSGYREFNIIANGATLESNFDVFATALATYGNGDDAISETFTVTVAPGAKSLELDFVNAGGYYGALVNGIELTAPESGTASPTASVYVLTNGLNYTQLASGIAINAYGQGQYIWTVNNDSSAGNTKIKVLSGTTAGTSQKFLIANGGTVYYVNDALQANDQYTAAAGNDANSGKSPSAPVASLSALFRAYPIGPGDTILVDNGTYLLPSNIGLTAANSGTAAHPVVIEGPTLPGTAATINRNNQSSGADAFILSGVDYIDISHLTLNGGYDGIDVTAASNAVTLTNDIFSNNFNDGVDVPDSAYVTNLIVSNSEFIGNAQPGYNSAGLFIGYYNTGITLIDDAGLSNDGFGLYLKGSNETVQGGTYGDSQSVGITISNNQGSNDLIADVVVYGSGQNNGNGVDGIDIGAGATVTGSTVFGNRSDGISAGGGLVSDNVVYDQSSIGIYDTGATVSGNTTFGDGNGIDALYGVVEDNLSYDNTGTGIYQPSGSSLSVVGNTVYGNAVGISLTPNYTSTPDGPISGNLIYDNTATGLALISGAAQQVTNNTIYQPVGTGIALSGGDSSAIIENNIIAVGSGAALSVAPNSETGLFSDYNMFDLTGTGAVGAWESASYAGLAAWYYATGLDQHSQVGNPDFVLPAGADGILGFQTISASPQVVTNFATTGVWTAYTGGSGGAGATALQTAAGSGATATWSVSGLTVNGIYQIAVNWPSNFLTGNALYTVKDANGHVLAVGSVNQYDYASTGISGDGVGFTLIGDFAATTSTVTVTLTQGGNDVVIADAVLVQELGINHGADDDFHVATGSPTIDAGDHSFPFGAEPSPNGGRVNLGYDGNTAQAQTSGAAQTLQVTNPAQFGKYEVGEQVPITIVSTGVSQIQPAVLIAAGQAAIDTATEGQWQGDIDRLNGTTFQNYSSTVVPVAGIPAALFKYGSDASNSTPGTALNYFLPATSGTYTLRLFFAEPQASASGQRVFNVVVNGVTMQANYDVFSAAGGENKGVELDLTVGTETLNGVTGIALSFVNVSGYYGAFVNAIELDRTLAVGSIAPTATVQVSTDSGATWATIGASVPISRFGYGSFNWTVDRTSTGTALIKVTAGGLSAESLPFQLTNGGTLFYVNDGSTAGDQYSTAVGNDANTGKSPDQPMASLAALLRAYPIGPGDTIFVDTGNYIATSDAVLTPTDAGTAADPALIVGPTNGGTATINRDNANGPPFGNNLPGADAIDVNGASWITIADLTLTGAYDGVDIGGVSNGVTLTNDIVHGNSSYGILVGNVTNGTVNALAINNSTVFGNGTSNGSGIDLTAELGSAALSNDQVYNNAGDGIDVDGQFGSFVMTGGAVYSNADTGIYAYDVNYTFSIAGVQVHGNLQYGINANGYNGYPVITGNTVYANAYAGINAGQAQVIDNTVYQQVNTSYSQIQVGSSTVTGNTIYGGSTGLNLGGSSMAVDNLIYGNSGTGLYLNGGSNDTVTGNIAYGDQTGLYLQGSDVTATNNLVYANVATGVAIAGGNVVDFVNNTVYQSVGTALVLSGGVQNVLDENNILWVDQGTIISVASGSSTGFVSAYNLFYQGADATPATLGSWLGTPEATLANWQAASGKDVTGSKTGNPGFVNIKGADQVQGGVGTPVGVGADDDFELSANSPAIDAANATAAPYTDLLGQPRHDDPATTNTGVGNSLVMLSTGASVLPTGGTGLGLHTDGGYTTYTFTNGFIFTLNGVSYSSVSVSSRGYLQFGSFQVYEYNSVPNLYYFLHNPRIAAFWEDLNTNGAGDDVYVTATATSVTFRWAANADNGGEALNFSITLNSDGSFVFNYGAGIAAALAAGLNPIVGVSAGNYGQAYFLATLSSTATPGQLTFKPQLGVDIGAIEFQGSSADTSLLTVTAITVPPTNASLPSNNAATALAFGSIVLTFSEPLDYVSANSPKNYSLIEADSGGSFTAADAITIPVTPEYVLGSQTVTLLLPNGVLANGKYQLTLSGTLAIFDASANKLAGNGGTAGTNQVVLFQINRSADQPPVASAQAVSTNEGNAVQIVLTATDAADLPLIYTIAVPPGDGTLSAISNGNTITYTPAGGFFGTDAFTFQATDPDGAESQAVVSLTVSAVDQAPVAFAQSVSVYYDQSQVIILGGSDAQVPASQLTYTITSQPVHGTLTPLAGSPGAFTYTPASATYTGPDSFAYTVTDTGNPPGTLSNAKTSAPATVSISLVDPAPIGVPATYTTRASLPLVVPVAQGVLAHDLDAAGDTLTATLITGPAHGTLALKSNGAFTYTPPPAFVGTITFTYTPAGALPGSVGAPVTVTITVLPNVAPPAPPPSPPRPMALAAVATAFSSAGAMPASDTADLADAGLADAGLADAGLADTRHATAPAAVKPARRHTARHLPPSPQTADAATPVAVSDLLTIADPILLPGFTMAGDEVATLMLPAVPEITHLHHAHAEALRRLHERAPTHITFVDPITGRAEADEAASILHRTGHQPWLMVDTNEAARPSRITWETASA
jgi:parallel beta-helix repeat protein